VSFRFEPTLMAFTVACQVACSIRQFARRPIAIHRLIVASQWKVANVSCRALDSIASTLISKSWLASAMRRALLVESVDTTKHETHHA
jgi:hypothetical protein